MEAIQILITLFLILAVNALAIIGFHYSVQFAKTEQGALEGSKNILWRLKFYGDVFFPEWIQKPLYACMRCMTSVHGTYIYFPAISYSFPMETWIYFACYPVYVLALSGLMILIESKFNV